jgi:hypothetical protein
MSESSLNPVADIAKNGRIENLFHTPLFSYVFKNVNSLNAELRDLILERERATSSAVKSNMGGWQSQIDFLDWDGSAVQTLRLYLGLQWRSRQSSSPLWLPTSRSSSI